MTNTASMTIALDAHVGHVKGPRQRSLPPPYQPEVGQVWHPLVSADDHVLEPPDAFEGRMSRKFASQAPRVVESADGLQYWQFADRQIPILGSNAVVSWAKEDQYVGPIRFDEIRPATFDPKLRAEDMTAAGIVASLCFPSMVWGFAGQRIMDISDHDLALAVLRAYNDWVLTGWCAAAPGRFLPCQLAWLHDPAVAAQEVRANAERGFTSVTFPENPESVGYPSLYSQHWEPFFAACADTDTVVNLHVGSSSRTFKPSADSPAEVIASMFPLNALAACLDWLYAGIPVRHPDLKIVLSESGIAWVPYLLDRLEYVESHIFSANNDGGLGQHWPYDDLSPTEVLRRNFWFTTYYDPTSYRLRDRIGVDRIMLEVDYPHPDSTWPLTQEYLRKQLDALPADDVDKITLQNALALYRHAL